MTLQFFVARGAKDLVLYPPSQSENLYAAPKRIGEHLLSNCSRRICQCDCCRVLVSC